jgi:hypothetical protein
VTIQAEVVAAVVAVAAVVEDTGSRAEVEVVVDINLPVSRSWCISVVNALWSAFVICALLPTFSQSIELCSW